MQAYMHVCNMIQRCPLTTPCEQGENMMAGWGCPDKDSLELTRGDESTPPRTAVCKSIAWQHFLFFFGGKSWWALLKSEPGIWLLPSL